MDRRNLKKLVAGLGARVRNEVVTLRDAPGVEQIEQLMSVPGAQWAVSFEEKVKTTCLALFGVTDADTRPPEPHPDSFVKNSPLARWFFSDDEFDSYNRALTAWYDWQAVIGGYEAEIRETGALRFWRKLGIDVTDDAGLPLASLSYFGRPMYAAAKGLLPDARLTLDGSGRRAAQSAEDWGAALAAEAAKFRAAR